jgi:hypothetical protein
MQPRRRFAAAAVAAGACLPLAATAPTAAAHPGHDPGAPPSADEGMSPETRNLLREVRRATRAFKDLDTARAAGYERVSPCESDPKYGAMGFHYANPELLADGVIDPLKPEILVYQPTRGGDLELGAVEYFQVDADQDLDTNDDLPYLFGVPFDGPMHGHNPEMPKHYDLHAWLYRDNPAGLFAMWNPAVKCPPMEPAMVSAAH